MAEQNGQLAVYTLPADTQIDYLTRTRIAIGPCHAYAAMWCWRDRMPTLCVRESWWLPEISPAREPAPRLCRIRRACSAGGGGGCSRRAGHYHSRLGARRHRVCLPVMGVDDWCGRAEHAMASAAFAKFDQHPLTPSVVPGAGWRAGVFGGVGGMWVRPPWYYRRREEKQVPHSSNAPSFLSGKRRPMPCFCAASCWKRDVR